MLNLAGCSHFARHYSGNLGWFLFLQLLRCFSSPRSPCIPMYSVCNTPKGGFPHSEICGSKCVCSLPAAYRKLLRPSSPVIAKASTMCTYSLVPITLASQSRSDQETVIRQTSTTCLLVLALDCSFEQLIANTIWFDTIKTHQRISTMLAHHWFAPINLYFFQIVKEQKQLMIYLKDQT